MSISYNYSHPESDVGVIVQDLEGTQRSITSEDHRVMVFGAFQLFLTNFKYTLKVSEFNSREFVSEVKDMRPELFSKDIFYDVEVLLIKD
jgi:hypothetical protein